MKPAGITQIFMISFCLSLCCACSAKTPQQAVRFTPPETLLMDTEVPSRDGASTVGDLVRLLVRAEAAIRQCHADKLGLREYTARVTGGSDE